MRSPTMVFNSADNVNVVTAIIHGCSAGHGRGEKGEGRRKADSERQKKEGARSNKARAGAPILGFTPKCNSLANAIVGLGLSPTKYLSYHL